MADTQDSGGGTSTSKRVIIKKYANRRLYNTATSSYVTLEHLANMVKKGVDFVAYDAKTNEDITRTVLTQIIFEEESQGQGLLPIQFLRQLIGFYGHSMQSFLAELSGAVAVHLRPTAGAAARPVFIIRSGIRNELL